MNELKQCYFDQSPAGIAITDLKGQIEIANQRFSQITRANEQQDIGGDYESRVANQRRRGHR